MASWSREANEKDDKSEILASMDVLSVGESVETSHCEGTTSFVSDASSWPSFSDCQEEAEQMKMKGQEKW